MKTKIIYISGRDVFEMADIRAAFSEVRDTLGLDSDTVLFAVPVDTDDSGISVNSIAHTQPDTMVLEPTSEIIDIIPQSEQDCITEIYPLQNTDTETSIEPEIVPAPKKVPKRAARTKAKDMDTVDVIPSETEAVQENDEKIIPILSVLASKTEPVDLTDTDIDIKTEFITEDIIPTEDIILSKNPIITETVEPEMSECETHVENLDIIESVDVEQVRISDGNFSSNLVVNQDIEMTDMITDDAPIADQERTLEQLLATMAPLREDRAMDDIDSDIVSAEIDTDATLAMLASEFAEKQDEIISTPKAETSGKIGKLKNILPFKKAKREDSGLMGDLFGWAGIAANDDDFAIPGFFTTTASKK